MRVGIPREVKEGELRVALSPKGIASLRGVVVEPGAGAGVGFGDEAYLAAGAKLGDPWQCELIVKVKELQPAEHRKPRPGQTVTAFWHSVRHARPLAVGLNCALGAALMRPYIQELHKVAPDTFISCYPNAGLPNPMAETGFDEKPEDTSRLLREFAAEGLVNIVGGCCGTTPEHIAAIGQAVQPLPARATQRAFFYKEAA